MRRLQLIVIVLAAWGWLSVLPARAGDLRSGDLCAVAADEVITGTVFATCRELIVAGQIQGDLYAIAVDAQIGGTIGGDVYLVALRATLDGAIGGDVHFGGGGLQILPGATFDDPTSDILSGAVSTQIDSTSIPGSVTGIGYQLMIGGAVGREVNFWGTALEIAGRVDGPVYAEVGDPASTGVSELSALLSPLEFTLVPPGLRLAETARLGGQLTYRSTAAGVIPEPLLEQVEFQPIERAIPVDQPADFGRGLQSYLSQVMREFITLGIVGMIALLLAPRALQLPLSSLRWRPLPSLGIGLIAFLLSFPIVLILLVISLLLVLIVGLARLSDLTAATAVILGVVNFSGAGLFYFVAIFIARVIVGLAFGRLIVAAIWKDTDSARTWIAALVVGLLGLALAASLPVVGWIFNALAAFLGLGAILTYLQTQLERARDVQSSPSVTVTGGRIPIGPPPLPDDPSRTRQLPAPPLTLIDLDAPTGPGMDNLPDGFSWWE